MLSYEGMPLYNGNAVEDLDDYVNLIMDEDQSGWLDQYSGRQISGWYLRR